MFRFKKKPSSGSHSQYLAKIKHGLQRNHHQGATVST